MFLSFVWLILFSYTRSFSLIQCDIVNLRHGTIWIDIIVCCVYVCIYSMLYIWVGVGTYIDGYLCVCVCMCVDVSMRYVTRGRRRGVYLPTISLAGQQVKVDLNEVTSRLWISLKSNHWKKGKRKRKWRSTSCFSGLVEWLRKFLNVRQRV